MAHNLENVGDMVYVGVKPWHDHGEQVTEIKELPRCLNFEIDTLPVFLEGNPIAIPNYRAIVRTDTSRVFNIASDDYTPHQNKKLWETFTNFCEEGNMTIETAGALKGGEIVWILAKIQTDPIHVGSDYDISNLYALLGSGHNNKFASVTKPTAVRVVCNNTFDVAMASKGAIDRQVHKSEFDPNRAKNFVNTAILGFNKYAELANQLASKSITAPVLSVAYAQELLQPEVLSKNIFLATNGRYDLENTKAEWVNDILSNSAKESIFNENTLTKSNRPVKQLVEAIKVEQEGGNTWWHNFNGATRYVDHVRSRTVDNRLYNAWFGTGGVLKQKAMELALAYSNG